MQREVLIPRLQALNLTPANALAHIDFMSKHALDVPDASSRDAASYSLAKAGLEHLRNEESQVLNATLDPLVQNLRVERTCQSLAMSIERVSIVIELRRYWEDSHDCPCGSMFSRDELVCFWNRTLLYFYCFINSNERLTESHP